MSRGPRWSAEEEATLRRLYPVASWPALCRALPRRALKAIKVRAMKRGLHRPLRDDAWTAREEAVLREVYPRDGARAAQRALPHRTLYAIRQRAKRIGALSRGSWVPWSAQEVVVLYELYPDGGMQAVQRALPRRTAGAIEQKLKLHGITRNTSARTPAAAAPRANQRDRRAARWTAAELDALRELYPEGGTPAAQRALPARSAKSIANRAHLEGLSRRYTRRDKRPQCAAEPPAAQHHEAPAPQRAETRGDPMRPWSTVEIKTLRRVLPAGGIDAVRRLMPHRAPDAIRAQARVLQIPGAGA